MNVGRTSPGIVFERIIQGLSKKFEIDLVTADYDPSINLTQIKNTIVVPRYFRHPRIYKALISLLKIDPRDILWARKVGKMLRSKNIKNHDLVLSLISFHHYSPLLSSVIIGKTAKIKKAAYFVDAIPAPIGWSKDDGYFRAVKKMMARLLPDFNYLFSSNPKMLEYQLGTFNSKKDLVSEVLFNPMYGEFRNYRRRNNLNYMFLYTGGIYGLRNPQFVISAFKLILKEFPESTLEFVGSIISEHYFKDFSQEERKKVLIHPFTKDLHDFYERATALIDIDADLADDVYLSGKVMNYMLINRIIISETGKTSPARELFSNISSIIQCDHSIEEMAKGMKSAILKQNNQIDFGDRKYIIDKFKLDSVIDTFIKTIQA